MSRAPSSRPRPRGYTLLVVLVTAGVALGFVAVLSSLAMLEWKRDHMSVLNACAEQVLASAQVWSRSHARELASPRPVELAVETLAPPPTRCRATLRRTTGEGVTVDVCEVRVERGALRLTRRGSWAAASPAETTMLP